MKNLASLSNIQYELGETFNIENLDFLASNPEKLRMYQDAGLVNYAKTALPVPELCFNSLVKTLNEANIDKDAIDMVLFVSENAKRDFNFSIKDANALLLRLELKNALPVAVALSDCANILTGLQMGVSLVASKMAKNVLLVCYDKLPDTPAKRKMPHEMSVLSDGSVSCLIREPGAGEYDIVTLTHKNAPSQWNYFGLEESNMYSMQKFKSLVTVTKKVLKTNEIDQGDIRKIFASNYLKHISKMFIEIAGFKEEQGYYPNLQRFAHTLAGDILINLKDYAAEEPLLQGDKVFLLIDSFSACGSLLLVKT